MIMVLVLMSIIRIFPASVVRPIAVVTLLEKDLGGELSLKKKNVNSIYM